jgi:hypothetical protein
LYIRATFRQSETGTVDLKRHRQSKADTLSMVIRNLKEAGLAAESVDDKILLYLIERAILRASILLDDELSLDVTNVQTVGKKTYVKA